MKSILAVSACAAVALFAVSARAQTERPAQTFKSSAGPIKVTPVYHASLVIEAGGKVIVVDPPKPAVFTGLPQAREDGGFGWVHHYDFATRFDNQRCMIHWSNLDRAC